MRDKKDFRRSRRQMSMEQLEPRMLLAVDIDVSPFDHQQEFIGAGSGYGLYAGHIVNGTPAAQREEVYDWLFTDLNTGIIRMLNFRGEAAGNDNSDPFDLNLAAMDIPFREAEFEVYQQALARNPDIKLMSYTNTHPDYLKNPDGSYNTSFPNFYEELAEYWYGNLVNLKQEYGIQLDILDVLNEPDLNPNIDLSLATNILAKSVPALRQMVETNFATYGVAMPLISGFSNLTAASAMNWLEDIHNNNQQAWDNLDILTTHPYGGGGSGFESSNYQAIAALMDADHSLFIQNEMEFGHTSFLNNSNSLPEDISDDELEGALAQARVFAISIDAGANGSSVFQGNNPSNGPASSLVHTVWGQPAYRRTGYYTYQQLTSLQPKGSDVVSDVTTGAPAGFHTVAFNKWGDNKVYLNIVNATSNAELANFEFRDNSGDAIEFNHIKKYSTSETETFAVSEQILSPGTTSLEIGVPANSVQTFEVTLRATGYSFQVGDLTYLRETSTSNLNTTPQDGDLDPRTEYLVGLNGTGSAGSQRGEMRALMEFDLSGVELPSGETIDSARLEMLGYRGSVGASESIGFELHEYSGDFIESQSTWVDPDGDGSSGSGDTTQGGTLGDLLSVSSIFDGNFDDLNANGTTKLLNQSVVFDGNGDFIDAVIAGWGEDLRLLMRPDMGSTTNGEFFGFLDEDSAFAPELIITTVQNDFGGPTVVDAVFSADSDQSIAFTFDEPIDLATLQVEDFEFENLDHGLILSGSSDTFLVGVTSTSASIVFRELPLLDGNWEARIAAGEFSDPSGNPNSAFSFQFSVLGGDADGDNDVDGADFLAWQRGLGTIAPNGTTSQGDFDHDLDVDAADLAILLNNYGQSATPLTSSFAAGTAPSTSYPAIDLAKLQTTTASSSDGGTIPSEATDGIVSNDSRWYSQAGSGPHWLEVELTTPYPVGSAQLFLGKDDAFTVASFEIQYHNGSSWQTITTVTGNTATDLNLVFPAPIETATRYRFYTTESVARVKEFVLLPPNGGVGHSLGTDVDVNLAARRAPIGSGIHQSNYPINVVDGWVDDNSRWLAPNSTGLHTLELEIPTSHEIGSLHLYSGLESGGSTQSVLEDFTIDYANGAGWTPIPGGTVSSGSMVGNSVTGNSSSELVITFSTPISADTIKISFAAPFGRIRELVVLPANVTNTGAPGYPIGTSVIVAPKPSTSFVDFGDDWYRIANRTNNNSLITSASGSSQADTSTSDDEKRFELLYSYALDAYRIRNQDSGKTIEVQDASMGAGAAIVEGDYSAAPHQLWRLELTDGGYYQIVNVWSGMVLETNGGSSAIVTQQPQDFSANPTNSQEWQPIFQDDYFKKGTGGWVGSYNTGWAYDWARNGPNPSDQDFFYVPMQHREGWPNLSTLHREYHEWNSAAKPAFLLGYNEPDKSEQANMTVARGIELWPRLTSMDIPLVSPSNAQGGEDWWLSSFMDQTDSLGYRVDYAGGHWYSSPSVDSIFNHINDIQNKSNGRDVWLKEFSVVDWSGGSGNWSEESNFNFIIEFLWRAESKGNLDKYAVFLFSGSSPTNPWDLTNPRSNFFSGGSLTPFGKAYAAWDGDTTIHDNRSYIIHNRHARHRLQNDGSSSLTQDTIRNEDASVQWYFEDAGGGKKYITSILDGQRLRYNGANLDYAPASTTGADVEWSIQQEQYGWHNIIHSATGDYLRLVRTNDGNNAPTSLQYEMVTAAQATGFTSTDWWFVNPLVATPPPNTSGPEVAGATFNANTNQSFDFTFSASVDVASIETSDFVFESLDHSFSLTGNDLFLVNATSTSATILFRDLPLVDGNWKLTVSPGAITDSAGAGNPSFTMLFTVLNGDADFDGDIDGADFLAWQRGYGSVSPNGTASIGDADHDLDVDSSDLAIWQSNYGVDSVPPAIETFVLSGEHSPAALIESTTAINVRLPHSASVKDAAMAHFASHEQSMHPSLVQPIHSNVELERIVFHDVMKSCASLQHNRLNRTDSELEQDEDVACYEWDVDTFFEDVMEK